TPPQSLDDLLDPIYRGKLILQDPRMSSPGLQFLFWVLASKGEEEGFRYLRKLKDSIQLMTPSWSSSYSLFKMQDSSLVFSYFSSPNYHRLEENDPSYMAAPFKHPHPVQVEYLGIPEGCGNCENAKTFAAFLMESYSQKILMTKNYMFPVYDDGFESEAFQLPKGLKFYAPIENQTLLRRKKELVNRWKKVFF
ncbi:MAG: thiamine ABC transporter substrate-binding protein, partial [Pseudomonadota bacterium]